MVIPAAVTQPTRFKQCTTHEAAPPCMRAHAAHSCSPAHAHMPLCSMRALLPHLGLQFITSSKSTQAIPTTCLGTPHCSVVHAASRTHGPQTPAFLPLPPTPLHGQPCQRQRPLRNPQPASSPAKCRHRDMQQKDLGPPALARGRNRLRRRLRWDGVRGEDVACVGQLALAALLVPAALLRHQLHHLQARCSTRCRTRCGARARSKRQVVRR